MIDLWVKALMRFPANIRRAENLLANKPSPEIGKAPRIPLVIDLRTPQMLFDSGRHLACLAANARLAGSRTVIRCSRLLLAEISRKQFGETLLSDPGVSWVPQGETIPTAAFMLYDASRPRNEIAPGERAMRMMIGRDVVPGTTTMPYPMHPGTLSIIDSVDFEGLRTSDRQVSLLFAGTQKARYGHPRITQGFGVMSRVNMLDTVRAHGAGRVRESVTDASSDRNAIALIDSQTHGVDSHEWLPTLAKSDFFLCCPGAAQPMCHNVVEAMSVGTIPIIEYGNRFAPTLSDGVNAICFQGANGLRESLIRIDQLSDQQISSMRENVVNYFENHLRGDRFLAALRDGAPRSGVVSLPFNNRNLFADVGTASKRAA